MDNCLNSAPHHAFSRLFPLLPAFSDHLLHHGNDPQATAREFTAGYWHSGDLGAIDADGFVRVFDRKKDLINRGGYKIHSAEVESVLIAHPAVVEAAVVAKPCPVLGERVHAFVCLRDDATGDALRAHCAAQLSDYKVPETFTPSRDPLPRNANGKLLKRLLRDQVAGGVISVS
ncbi:MAG: hypothetical protein OHK0044_30650 [Burkholderiaceae bacterium]